MRLACAFLFALALGACAGPPKGVTSSVELVLAADEPPADGQVGFPTSTYESVVRVDLPSGKHKLLRARVQLAAPGKVRIALYRPTPFEGPGEAIFEVVREATAAEVSDGRDGKWLVEDLQALDAAEGMLFLGVRKEAGAPQLWSTGVDSGRAFMRDLDPAHVMGLAPVRRTPRVRLDVAP